LGGSFLQAHAPAATDKARRRPGGRPPAPSDTTSYGAVPGADRTIAGLRRLQLLVHKVNLSNVALAAAIAVFTVTGAIGLVAPRKPPYEVRRDAAPGPRERPAAERTRSVGVRDTRAAGIADDPGRVVTAYYAALDARRFGAAWRTLGPAVRARFGSFAGWRAGYATTRSSRPERLRVTRTGSSATVEHVLAATDRTPCGPVRRRFAVRWTLLAEHGRWTARALTAVALATAPCGSS
jgi:hypothetical protein